MKVYAPAPGERDKTFAIFDTDDNSLTDHFVLRVFDDAGDGRVDSLDIAVLSDEFRAVQEEFSGLYESIKVTFNEDEEYSWRVYHGTKRVDPADASYTERATPQILEKHYPKRNWTKCDKPVDFTLNKKVVKDRLSELRLDYMLDYYLQHINSMFGVSENRDVSEQEVIGDLFRVAVSDRLERKRLGVSNDQALSFADDPAGGYIYAFISDSKDESATVFRAAVAKPDVFKNHWTSPANRYLQDMDEWTPHTWDMVVS